MSVVEKPIRKTGVIKLWTDRGWGFIKIDDIREYRDTFFHISDWLEIDVPSKGDRVTFIEGVGDRGPIARQVTRRGHHEG
jgi:cold shock CspA family protein